MTLDSATQASDFSIGFLLVATQGPISIVTINRPDKLNAMHTSIWADLRTVLGGLQTDGKTRAVVITGAGDRAFSAGGDIAGFAELHSLEQKRAFQNDAMQTFAAVEESTLPIIAAVNGYALGGGCELTLACDIVIASDRARFGMPESAIGLVPGYGVLRAPQIIGRQMTKLLVMAAEKIDAVEALRIGLVQRVVPHESLMRSALEIAHKIAANSSFAHLIGKKLINRGIDRSEFDYSVEALTVLQSSDDTREGIAAFLERRQPQFPSHNR
jgi:enoyl-CoA hydratase